MEPKLIWATPNQRGFQSRSGPSSSQAAGSSGYVAYSAPPLSTPSYAGSSRQRRVDPAQTAAQLEAARKRQEEFQKAADLKKMLNSLESVDDDERRSSLLDQLLATDDILALPVHSNPPGVGNGLVVDLLKHQSQALQWAVEKEYPVLPKTESDKPVQFWQLKKNGNQVLCLHGFVATDFLIQASRHIISTSQPRALKKHRPFLAEEPCAPMLWYFFSVESLVSDAHVYSGFGASLCCKSNVHFMIWPSLG